MFKWTQITSDKTTLSWVNGYKIPFTSKPVQKSEPKERRWSAEEMLNVRNLLLELEEKGATRRCRHNPDQFVSDIFLAQKPNGKYRLILNLKNLNRFITTKHFKLEDGRTVTKLMNQNCFMASLDLKDAYYLVPMHRSSQRYLRFKFGNTLFEFTCLPFGLNTAPYVFTKILKPFRISIGWEVFNSEL